MSRIQSLNVRDIFFFTYAVRCVKIMMLTANRPVTADRSAAAFILTCILREEADYGKKKRRTLI